MAIDPVLADGSVEERGGRLLKPLQQLLRIPGYLAIMTVEALLIKDRG
jgi:hypothetical protein